ncbi:hypothetical protein Celaphus_00008669 [Cervus elaphus hippelaphus]|uniref:ADAM8 n=1 Tax=Cervus elaphus hippelaphus TaxID=46360 RepID=A0A212CNX3_CEREH|nr:hypothetical protein Celaphus_00008669 [Cervus elaphus hippelaphus]
MWNGGDKIQVSSQPDATLDSFLAWRARELVGRQAHDNVQLITGVDFTGTTVGLAKVSAMCSQGSGAVNQDCQNRCCNASTCLLAKGAECAHGACCHECRVKPAGEPCRPAKDQCDLGEHCDGRWPTCPEDAFRENGAPCPGGYCYNGACPTLAQRCRDLWGPGSRVAVETCFRYGISEGCRAGVPLQSGRVNRCGTLFCEGGQEPPERGYCILTTSSGICRAVIQDGSTAYEPVPKGTKCGEEQVCWDGFCQDLHVYRSRNCSARCNGHGECNHEGQCHCHPGWAPPYCAEPPSDTHAAPGSLRTRVLAGVGALVVLVLILVGVLIYCKARSPVRRRNVAPKSAMGLSNPLFQEGLSKPAEGGAQAPPGGSLEPAPSSQPAKPTASSVTPKRPPPAPPAAMASPPSPLPVYPPQAPGQQLRPAPPAKPLPVLKPKQVIKPTCAPPIPPVKPGVRGAQPGPTQVALNPVQRR